MRFIKADSSKTKSEYQNLVRDFLDSGMEKAEIVDFNGRSANVFYRSLTVIVSRYKLQVKVSRVGNKIYLIKK